MAERAASPQTTARGSNRRHANTLRSSANRAPSVRKFSIYFAAPIVCLSLLAVTAFGQNSDRGQVIPNRAVADAGVAPNSNVAGNDQSPLPAGLDVDRMLSPGGMSSTLKIMLLLTVLSLAPSILMMTTCFIRFVIVLGLLRQALGTQQLPPNQVITSLCLFLTFLVMAPVWKESYEQGVRPYTDPAPGTVAIGFDQALQRTISPLRRFMSDQIEAAGNSDAVWTFLEFQRPNPESPEAQQYQEPENYDDVPLSVLLPAFMLSELKVAFVIGFQIYLPFLIIDMVVSSVLISMGMMMLPPVLISLPFKLLLFVMIDGWYLSVGMLLEKRAPFWLTTVFPGEQPSAIRQRSPTIHPDSPHTSRPFAMTTEQAVELARAAVMLTLTISAPVMAVAVVIGLLISILQAVTQLQDQTLSFVPKIVAMLLTLLIVLPWMLSRMVEYSTALIHDIPSLM